MFRAKECEEYAHILMMVGDEGYCPVSSGGQKESGTGIGSIQEQLEEMQLSLAIM